MKMRAVFLQWHRVLVLIITLLATSSATLAPDVARAHSNLVRSAPEANSTLDSAPAELRLWFSERPEPRFSSLQILDRSGQAVDVVESLRADSSQENVLVATLRPLESGLVTVMWRAASAIDGHVSTGTFAFVIGKDEIAVSALPPTQSQTSASGPTPPAIVIRWLGYLAMALLAGSYAFTLVVHRPPPSPALLPMPAVAKRKAGGAGAEISVGVVGTLPFIGLLLATVTTLIAAATQAASSANVDVLAALGSPMLALLTETRYGAIFWARLTILALLGGAMVLARWQAARTTTYRWLGFGLSCLLPLTYSLGSHAAAGSQPLSGTVSDWIHLTSASVWLGGLIVLPLALVAVCRTSNGSGAVRLSPIVHRFSLLAASCVAVLAMSGGYRAIGEIGDVANLLDTPYGTTLLAKLGLLTIALGLAAINLLVIKRRLHAADSQPAKAGIAGRWHHRLTMVVAGEVLIIATVLVAASVLTTLAPARVAFGSGIVLHRQVDDLRAVLAVTPGSPGLNTFDLYLRNGLGQTVSKVEEVDLQFAAPERNTGVTEAIGEDLGDGHYRVYGAYVSLPARWGIQVLVRQEALEDARLLFTLVPRERDQLGTAISGEPIPTQLIVAGAALAVGMLLLLGAILLTPQHPPEGPQHLH